MDEIEFYLKDLASRFPKDTENYYLSYSGGRDSHFLYWFIKEYLKDDKIKIVGINTFMEHPQILKRIRENSDVILYPELKPFQIKERFYLFFYLLFLKFSYLISKYFSAFGTSFKYS